MVSCDSPIFAHRHEHKWFTGQGRACLLRWIAAATVVQHAVRVWQFRCGLMKGQMIRQALQTATLRLQARWRAKQPFRSYQALRYATIRTQVCDCFEYQKSCLPVFSCSDSAGLACLCSL